MAMYAEAQRGYSDKQPYADRHDVGQSAGMGSAGHAQELGNRSPEVPALLKQLAMEISEAESVFSDLRSRLTGLTRSEDPATAGANAIQPVSSTDMGAELRNLANRVDELTGSMRSVLRRLEV